MIPMERAWGRERKGRRAKWKDLGQKGKGGVERDEGRHTEG